MKTILSGIQSTNTLTLGNYLGALKNFVDLQSENNLFIFIADLHSITVDFDPIKLKENRKSIACMYAACGLDFQKNIIFYQSSVPAHTQLNWILTCHSYMGELSRMTQFKDKTSKISLQNKTQNIPTGLFLYPNLMASDILLYDPDFVPVGKDQKQHIELTRDLAIRMNNKYKKKLFKIPEIYEAKIGAKIMNLIQPEIKMSKSNGDINGTIFLLDDLEIVRKKIMKAKTDSFNNVKFDLKNQLGISNLISIYSCLTSKSIFEIEDQFKNKSYGEFKNSLADIVVDFLANLQKKYYEFLKDDKIDFYLNENSKKANEIANKKIKLVYETLGLDF